MIMNRKKLKNSKLNNYKKGHNLTNMLTVQDKINFAKFIQNYPIEEFCINYNISYDDAFKYLTVLEIPEDCKGCINLKWYKSYMPCIECKRICTDYYERN